MKYILKQIKKKFFFWLKVDGVIGFILCFPFYRFLAADPELSFSPLVGTILVYIWMWFFASLFFTAVWAIFKAFFTGFDDDDIKYDQNQKRDKDGFEEL